MSLSRCYHRATNQLSAEDRCVHLGRQRARAKSCILMKCPEPKTGVNGTRLAGFFYPVIHVLRLSDKRKGLGPMKIP